MKKIKLIKKFFGRGDATSVEADAKVEKKKEKLFKKLEKHEKGYH